MWGNMKDKVSYNSAQVTSKIQEDFFCPVISYYYI